MDLQNRSNQEKQKKIGIGLNYQQIPVLFFKMFLIILNYLGIGSDYHEILMSLSKMFLLIPREEIERVEEIL